MKLAFAAACLAASLTFASLAHADGRTVANLAQPVSGKVQLIAAGASWVCEQTTCVAAYTTQDPIGASDCRQLADKVGRVSGFADNDRTLSASEIDRCNKDAPASVASAH